MTWTLSTLAFACGVSGVTGTGMPIFSSVSYPFSSTLRGHVHSEHLYNHDEVKNEATGRYEKVAGFGFIVGHGERIRFRCFLPTAWGGL